MHQSVINWLSLFLLLQSSVFECAPGTTSPLLTERLGLSPRKPKTAPTKQDTVEVIRPRPRSQLHTISEETDNEIMIENHIMASYGSHGPSRSIIMREQDQLDEQGNNVRLMRDFDPQIRKWSYPSGQSFDSYLDAYNYVQAQKYQKRDLENMMGIKTAILDTSQRAYDHPNGGVVLRSPYRSGVRFSDETLDWIAYIPKPKQNRLLIIGHFKDSRSAALAFNLASICFEKLHQREGLQYRRNIVRQKEDFWVDKTELVDRVQHFVRLVTGTTCGDVSSSQS